MSPTTRNNNAPGNRALRQASSFTNPKFFIFALVDEGATEIEVVALWYWKKEVQNCGICKDLSSSYVSTSRLLEESRRINSDSGVWGHASVYAMPTSINKETTAIPSVHCVTSLRPENIKTLMFCCKV